MTTHPLRLVLWGWPDDRLPSQSSTASFVLDVAYACNRALERTQRRVSVISSAIDHLPADWRPLGGNMVNGWPFCIVVKWNPAYCGNGYASVHDGAGLSIVEGSSLDLDKLNERDRGVMLGTPVHEFGHLCGCALGEMYDFGRYAVNRNNEFVVLDTTGLNPRCDLRILDPQNELFTHPTRADWLNDPMVRNDGTEFCALNRAIIDGDYSLSRAPRPDATVELVVEGVDFYDWSLWRQEQVERVYNPKTGRWEDGEPAHQEKIGEGDHYAAAQLPPPVLSMLKPSEHPDKLSIYDLFLLKLSGAGWQNAFWFSVWDFMGVDEARIRIRLDTPLQPPPLPSAPLRLSIPECGFDAGGKPVIRFRTNIPVASGLAVDSYGSDKPAWGDNSWFLAPPLSGAIEVPNRRQWEIFRVRQDVQPVLLALADRITTAGAAKLATPVQPWPRCECKLCKQ